MGQCFLYGNGGGRQLYYDVVCQMAEPTKKEGRIWVMSSVPMTYFEFSPTWAGAGNGTISIQGEIGGPNPDPTNNIIEVFNTIVARIRNRMKYTPHGCKQVQGSAGNWVNVDAYVCHSNTWVQFSSVWNGELFDNGNQYADVTGGWTGADSYSPNLSATLMNGTITISTVSAVDLSGFSTLKFIGSGNGAQSGEYYPAKCKIFNESGVEVASLDFQNNNTYAMSVAALSGKHYVRFIAQGSRGNNLNISKVWLE